MAGALVVRAGIRARERLADEGLRPDNVDILAGAAGGPKFLVLAHLDRILFSQFFADRERPLFLLGSSIGAWRFAAASRNGNAVALEHFTRRYLGQRYNASPTRDDITRETERIMEECIGENGAGEILNHPSFRLSIMTVRCRLFLGSDARALLLPGIVAAAIANTISRPLLALFFQRVIFYDSRDIPPFFPLPGFPLRTVPLTRQNFRKALMASGAIPLIMQGVRGIPGTVNGTFRDGGLIDYHPDIPFIPDGGNRGIVLYPHYSERIIPGWFDKNLSWRRVGNPEDILLLSPSREFIAGLPGGQIPDRSDFKRYLGRDDDRIALWNAVVDASRRLGEEFMDLVESGRIRDAVEPLP